MQRVVANPRPLNQRVGEEDMAVPPVIENRLDVLRASYVRKLVTELSGGVFGYLDSVLERHSFDEFGELI